MQRRADLATRFWKRVDRRGPDECWPWIGGKQQTGRGQLHLGRVDGKNIRASAPAVALLLTTGKTIPAGYVVCHSCDNPNCVNPSHLSTATQAENIHDSIRKGRYNTFGRQKLNAEQVRQIRARAATGEIHRTIAADFAIARHTVSQIMTRKMWAHLPDHPAMDEIFERVPSVQLPIRGEVG